MNTIKKKNFESLTNEIFQYSQCVNNLVQIEYLRNGFNSYPIYIRIYITWTLGSLRIINHEKRVNCSNIFYTSMTLIAIEVIPYNFIFCYCV